MGNTSIKRVNRLGVPTIANIGSSLTTARETITFNNHPNLSDNFQGHFTAYISNLPTAPTTAVPVYFNTDGVLGSDKQVFDCKGTAVTTSNLTNGVWPCFYDNTTGKVRVMLSF